MAIRHVRRSAVPGPGERRVPAGAFAMVGKERPVFNITGENGWRLDNPTFTFDGPEPGIASGGAWAAARSQAICPRRRSRSRCPMTC